MSASAKRELFNLLAKELYCNELSDLLEDTTQGAVLVREPGDAAAVLDVVLLVGPEGQLVCLALFVDGTEAATGKLRSARGNGGVG
jgi:hypothetical protein